MRFHRVVVAAVVGVGVCSIGAPTSAGAESAKKGASVYVVQGVAGTEWSVSVDGRSVADSAPGKEVIGPLDLAEGRHEVLAEGPDGVQVESTVDVRAGESLDLVLHRPVDVSADPLFTVFANDTSPVNDGSARLTVAHTAVAPPADIVVSGEVLLADVASAEQATTVVPAGVYPVEVVPAATDGPAVLGPVDLPVDAGTLTRVFAIGNASEQTMDAVVQILPVRTTDATAPDSVPAGDGSSAAPAVAESGSGPGPLAAVGLLLAVTILLLGALRVRRS